MTRPALTPSRVARYFASSTSVVALLAIFGWLAGYRGLAGIREHYVPMAPNTAFGFLVLSLALWALAGSHSKPRTLLSRSAALIVVALASATLLQRVWSGLYPVDRLVLSIPGTLGDVPLGVMSPVTAAGFLLAGAASLAFDRWRRVSAGLALGSSALGLAVVLGYLYGTPLLAGSSTIPLALNTAVCFVLAGAGLLAALGPEVPPLRALVGATVEARLLRAFVPLMMATVFVYGLVGNLALNGSVGNPAVFGGLAGLAAVLALGFVAHRVSRDLAERIRRADEEAQTARERLSTVLEQMSEMVAVVREGSLLFVNPSLASALGYEERSLFGRSYVDLVHPEDREWIRPRLHTIGAFGAQAPIREQRWWAQSGHVIDVEVSGKQVTFDGEPALLVVARDLAERRRLEDQLRQAVKMEAIGRLAGGVAHDFNNLLTVIMSYGNFVESDLGPDHTSQADVREITSAAARAAGLTRQLLAFSRQQVFEPRDLELNAIVAPMENMLRRLVGEDIELTWRPGPNVGRVHADGTLIEQIVLNFVVNARDAIGGAGKIVIETASAELDDTYVRGRIGASPGRYVMLAVSDSGVGMDDATREKIFEPFFTTKGPGQGTGLGLATVHGIVKQLGGDILVYSAPGEGTTFKVYLPESDAAVASPAEGTAPARRIDGVGITVLVVEDDPVVRRVTVRTLESSGYRVLEAGRPSEAVALAQAAAGPIHLVLTDVVMPEESGPELAVKLRALRPEARVLFTSGFTGGVLEQRGLVESGAAYLQKPFTPLQLAERVAAVLG